MCAKNSPDHWAKLLTEMGIQAPTDEAEPAAESVQEDKPQNKPVETAPVLPLPESVASIKPVTAARSASDWDRLAEELGIPVSQRPSQSPNKPCELPPAFDQAEPDATKTWEEEMGELTDPLLLDESTAESAADLVATESASKKPSEKELGDPSADSKAKSRRRRRRRRGRRLPETEPTEAEIQEVELEAAADAIELIDIEPNAAPTGDEKGVSLSQEDQDAAERKDRHKRRRRRRVRRKTEATDTGEESQPAPEQEQEEADRPSSKQPRAKKPAAVSKKDAEDDEWSDSDASQEDEEESSSQMSHRGIPTWEEAIQLVISHNLDSRAKNPHVNSSPRGHGNRRAKGKPSGK